MKGIAHKTLRAQLKEMVENSIISLYCLIAVVVLHRMKWEQVKVTSPTPGVPEGFMGEGLPELNCKG